MYDGGDMNSEQQIGTSVVNSAVPTGRHDPEGRRRQIVHAAAALIPEVGLAKLTHRRVAERAGVSLGATTRYFANLEELRVAALTEMSEILEHDLAVTRERFERDGVSPETLTDDICEFLAEHELVRISIELVVAANADPTLRPLANLWSEGIVQLLATSLGEAVARGIVLIMDGATMHASVNETPLSREQLNSIFAAILAGAVASE